MKKLNILFVIAFLTISSQVSFTHPNLIGKWVADCPSERIDSQSSQFCGICPTKQEESSLQLFSFEMIFEESQLTLIKQGKKETVPYNWDKETDTITFKDEGQERKFKLLYNNNEKVQILKTEAGQILLLTKN